MKLPLSIAGLQEQVLCYQLDELDLASISELCWLIRPFVVLHRIKITKSSFVFGDGNAIIFYDIINFGIKNGALRLLLRDGYLCILSGNNSGKKYIRVCDPTMYPRTGKIQLLWQTSVGNLNLFWWEMKEYLNRKVI